MNTPVSLEIKQLLFNKGWRYELGLDETGYRVKNSLSEERWNKGYLTYVDITIAEVLMWLYEKHGIWVSLCVGHDEEKTWFNGYVEEVRKGYNYEPLNVNFDISGDTPIEAYEASIEYILNNIL